MRDSITAPRFLCKNYPNDSAMHWLRMKLRDLGKNGLKIIQNWWIEILAIIFLISVIILIWVGYVRITIGGWPDWIGFVAKIIWDLMQLLIIPIVLAIGAYWLNESARQREQAITEQRAQETALQTYLDRMTELLLDKKLREPEVESEVRAVARARTLTVLRRLDGNRKGTLIQFLYEADLIDKNKRVINLGGADLTMADLTMADLKKAKLIEAKLSGAKLIGADLWGADLSKANLDGVDLSQADLSKADLGKANLFWANLSEVNLREADLSGADISIANLREADLSGADISGTNLSDTNLSGAKYTKNADFFSRDTIWPEGFDPDAAGAIRVND